MSRKAIKRGLSSKSRSSKSRSASPAPEIEDDMPFCSVVFGVLGDTFSLGIDSPLFHGRILAEVLLRAGMPAKLLHQAAAHDDVSADVIVVPDEVYSEHDGKLTTASLGLDLRTIKTVRAANAHQNTKYMPLSHFFACQPKTEQKHLVSKLIAALPARARPSAKDGKNFLADLPPLCLSGQVRYAHKNISKVQLTHLLNKLGIVHATDCPTENSIILGDSHQGAKYLNGNNVTVLSMWQFQALQSLKAHEVIAQWFQDQGEHSVPISLVADEKRSHKKMPYITQEDDQEIDMDDVIPSRRATIKRSASKKVRKTVRGHDEGDVDFDADLNANTYTNAEPLAIEGENEDVTVWDRIIF